MGGWVGGGGGGGWWVVVSCFWDGNHTVILSHFEKRSVRERGFSFFVAHVKFTVDGDFVG